MSQRDDLRATAAITKSRITSRRAAIRIADQKLEEAVQRLKNFVIGENKPSFLRFLFLVTRYQYNEESKLSILLFLSFFLSKSGLIVLVGWIPNNKKSFFSLSLSSLLYLSLHSHCFSPFTRVVLNLLSGCHTTGKKGGVREGV